jgi:ectoine hydroxylase-related dioxygenase (phytanoyl-CoA dioxygenase family)
MTIDGSLSTSSHAVCEWPWSEGPTLTDRHLTEYLDAGFTRVDRVITRREAESLRGESLKLAAAPSAHSRLRKGAKDGRRFLVDILMTRRSQMFHELAQDVRILRVAAHFIQASKFKFFYDQLFYKEAGAETRTQWHQDLPYWPLHGDRIPSIWIALTDVDEEGSAVQYLPGSHRCGDRFAAVDPEERDFARSTGVNVCPDLDVSAARLQLKSHQLQPGDAIVHHPLVVHGAGPNNTATDRVAVSLRYCAFDTVWTPRANTMFFPNTDSIVAGTAFGDIQMFRTCVVPERSLPTNLGGMR